MQALQLVFTVSSSSAADLLPLSRALTTNTCLQFLSIQRNKLQDPGSEVISNGLLYNNTLQYLDISGNRILKDGIRALCHALSHASSALRDLNLGCLYDEASQEAVSYMLTHNSTLQSLSISLSSKSDGACASASAVMGALRQNSTLRSLSILGEACGSDTLTTLAQILRENLFLTHFEVSICGDLTDGDLLDVGHTLQQTPRYHVVRIKGVPLTRVRDRLELPERPLSSYYCNGYGHDRYVYSSNTAWEDVNPSVIDTATLRRPVHHSQRCMHYVHDSTWTDENIVLHIQSVHHKKIVAFAMGQHLRLGEVSHVRILEPDTICMVALYYFLLPLGYFDASM